MNFLAFTTGWYCFHRKVYETELNVKLLSIAIAAFVQHSPVKMFQTQECKTGASGTGLLAVDVGPTRSERKSR